MQTLPWSWYTDPDVLRREQERIFRSAWQYVGHAGMVAEHGDQFAAEAGDVPVLVVRDGEASARLPQRLPSPRLSARRRLGERQVDPVPVPRVDVRAGREPARRTACRP